MIHAYRYHFVVLSVLAAACVAAACRSASSTPTAAVTADTWAVVDGRQIVRDDVEKAYRRSRDVSQTLSDEEALTAKLTLLNDLIVQDILLAKARELKVELPDSELDAAYAEERKKIPEETFQQELTRRGVTAADMREGLRRDLLIQKVIEREVRSKIAVTEQDVSDFFNANRAQFNVPEEAYHIAQIVVTPVREAQVGNRSGDDAATPQAAAAKTQMLMERLKGGASFRDLATDYSEDPESAPRGGDLGFVPVSRLKQAPPQLRDAGIQGFTRVDQRRERRRRPHHRAGGRTRAGGPTRSLHARDARADHRDTPRAQRAAAAHGVSHRRPERRQCGQSPRAAAGRGARQDADLRACGAEWKETSGFVTGGINPTIHLGGHTIGSMIRAKPAQSESVRADGTINSSELRG